MGPSHLYPFPHFLHVPEAPGIHAASDITPGGRSAWAPFWLGLSWDVFLVRPAEDAVLHVILRPQTAGVLQGAEDSGMVQTYQELTSLGTPRPQEHLVGGE